MPETSTELHNRLVGEIIASIVKPTLERGGTEEEILVILESVVTGVVLALVKLGGDEIVLDVLVEGVKERLASIRLSDIETAGKA